MTRVLVACDGASLPKGFPRKKWDRRITLTHLGNKANLNLRIDNITGAILKEISPISTDLIRIASYIYAGDQSVSRGSSADVYGHKWTRDLHFLIPVSNLDFWLQDAIQNQLSDTMLFLTGDNYTFHFVKGAPLAGRQLIMDLPGLSLPHDGADSVMLLSGGADSLCAVVESVAKQGKHPIMISHRSTPILDGRQSNIVGELRKRFSQWTFPHISVWVHLRGEEARDYTQRSRSFLYCVLAAVIADQTGINEIAVADNGVVSINIPKSAQVVGTYASRTTHPKFLYHIQELLQMVYGHPIQAYNPLRFRTRAEVLNILKENGCPELLQETVSCVHTRQQPLITPHCGVCSQCVDRRFGSLAAEMEEYDIPERYAIDIFTEELPEGDDRTQAESYVRFARHIKQLSDEIIFHEFVELFDCIIPGEPNPEATATASVDLLRRHAHQVSEVMENIIKKNASLLFEVTLPDTCLTRLVTSGTHSEDPRRQFASRIAERLRQGIPKTFQSRAPENEHEVQDAADAILSVAEQDLEREQPLLPFAGISTKPDFAKFDPSLCYVEMKYPKTRQRLNSIVTEITSRITVYKKQGAFALFAVYDPHHCITDDEKFKRDLSDDSSVVEIIR